MVGKKAFHLAAGAAALFSLSAFAGDSVTDDFESGTLDTTAWTGGSIDNGGPSAAPACGYAFTASGHEKILTVSGEAARSYSSESAITDATTGQCDFLVNVAEAGDENPDAPDGDVKIAIAAGSTVTSGSVPLLVYCKAKLGTGSAAWVEVGTISLSAWHRVSLAFDYANGLCKVSLDGVPQVSSYGYLATDKEDTTTAGAWYPIVTASTSDKVASVTFVGSASVDDLLVKSETVETFSGDYPTTIGGETVTYAQLNAWGVTAATAATASIDRSGQGLTVAEKLAAGLDPDGTVKFEVTGMNLASASSLTLNFPGSSSAASRYKAYYATSVDAAGTLLASDTPTVSEGVVSMSVTLPDAAQSAEVLYLTVKAVAE